MFCVEGIFFPNTFYRHQFFKQKEAEIITQASQNKKVSVNFSIYL